MKIHHIGIKVKSIDKSVALYQKIGYITIGEAVLDYNQNNKVLFMENIFKNEKIELIESANDKSSIFNFKEGLHHICYDVSHYNNFIEHFKTLGIGRIFTSPVVAPAINNRKVLFACLNNGCFVEFIL